MTVDSSICLYSSNQSLHYPLGLAEKNPDFNRVNMLPPPESYHRGEVVREGGGECQGVPVRPKSSGDNFLGEIIYNIHCV